MKVKARTLDLLVAASTDEERQQLAATLRNGGYAQFSGLLADLKHEMMACDEEQLEQVQALVRKAREIVPDPIVISPSWEKVWEEYEGILAYKEEVLRIVPHAERDGEWQVIMDNPFTNEGISCYPALSFIEAAYLYAYFRKDLKKTEYIRLQKITNLLMTQGS